MAVYQAKRSNKVTEEFELLNDKNEVMHHFCVELDASSMVDKLREKHVALVRANQEVSGIKLENKNEQEVEAAYEKLGNAVVDIIEAVFGAEDAKTIIDFYENRYTEMALEVIPFVTTVVIPRVHEVAKQAKKDVLSGYNRKQRRGYQKRVSR